MGRLAARTRDRPHAALGPLAHGWFVMMLGAPAAEPSPSLPPPPFAAHYELTWEAPADCPDASTIATQVEALLDPDAQGEGVVAVRGHVDRQDGGFRLALATEFRGRIDRRELEAAGCDTLADATALVIAGAMQPASSPTAERPASPPTPAPSVDTIAPPLPEVAPLPPVAPSSVAATRRGRRTRPIAVLRAAAMLEAGVLPGVSGGPQLAVGLAWPRWRLELHGAYLAPRRLTLAGGGARLMAGLGGVRGCRRIAVARFELPICVGVEAGAVRAATFGLASPRMRNEPQAGPLVSAGLARRWDRVGLWLAAEAVGRAVGTAFTFAGTERFRQAPVSGRVLAGVELFVP